MVWLDRLMNNDIDNLYSLKAGCLRNGEVHFRDSSSEGDKLFPYSWATTVALMPFAQVAAI